MGWLAKTGLQRPFSPPSPSLGSQHAKGVKRDGRARFWHLHDAPSLVTDEHANKQAKASKGRHTSGRVPCLGGLQEQDAVIVKRVHAAPARVPGGALQISLRLRLHFPHCRSSSRLSRLGHSLLRLP
jgi:hypothetical protein